MVKTGIGLDLGTNAIKLVEVVRGKNLHLNRCGMVSLPAGTLEDGTVKAQKVVVEALRKLMAQTDLKKKRMVVAVAGRSVVVRQLKLPLMASDELATAVKWEAESFLPFPLEEVDLDYQVVKKDEAMGELEVLLVGARKDLVRSHYETLRQAGIQPLAMDLQIFAARRSLGLPLVYAEGTVALLDLGAGKTDLLICKAGLPAFTRTLAVTVSQNRITAQIEQGFFGGFS